MMQVGEAPKRKYMDFIDILLEAKVNAHCCAMYIVESMLLW